MLVLGLNTGHDGSVVLIDDDKLVFSLEAEKDSFDRHSDITASLLIEALAMVPAIPDVIAVGGWHKILPGRVGGLDGVDGGVAAGYHGLEPGDAVTTSIMGHEVALYSSSHERSHIVGGIAMSPFDPDDDIAVLVWEGLIGSVYRWSGPSSPITRSEILDQPGARYSALFALAEPTFPDSGRFPPSVFAGKLMALAGLADNQPPTRDSIDVVDALLTKHAMYPFHKGLFRRSALYNRGVEEAELHRAARHMTNRLYEVFEAGAREVLPAGLPLVIAGGCGLNCEWNSRWRASGLFSEVFVPPCPNDSGSAIGTAADAAMQLGGAGHLVWDVYAGSSFVPDLVDTPAGWSDEPLDVVEVSAAIDQGAVVAWVRGRCEIGPRALGNRSLLASAGDARSKERLNRIKGRESYRPIAPICLEEDLGTWFDDARPDPYMLYFRRVTRPASIPAVTHDDGTARVQSVGPDSDERLRSLLLEHRRRTGMGVLCNTSLNFNGKGFINRSSELFSYCELVGIDHVVVDDRWFCRHRPPVGSSATARGLA